MFDAEPCLGTAASDLAESLFVFDYRKRLIATGVAVDCGQAIERQLASSRFFDLTRCCPTNAGVLLFGINVRYWLPGAYVQFLRVDGTNLSDNVVNDREVSGDLLSMLRDLDSLVDAYRVQRP